MAIKNFWSLSIDEAIVTDEIRYRLGKNYEVFFPVNSQLKDIDLVVFDLKKTVAKTVQVKGSKAHLGDDGEQYAWIKIHEDKIFNTKNKLDFFIFVWYVERHKKERWIDPTYLVIPLHDLQIKLRKEKTKRKNGEYHFYFWTDLNGHAFDYPTEKNAKKTEIDFSKYLDNFGLLK